MTHETQSGGAMTTSHQRAAAAILAAFILFALAPAAGALPQSAQGGTAAPQAAAPPGQVFTTPEAAVDAFVAAVRNFDLPTLLRILGDDSERLFVSEDPTADANLRAEFLQLYDQRHQIASPDETTKVLIVGANAWPLPVPLVRTGNGWAFDTAAGLDEVINRRVGRNELSAIQACLAAGDGQHEYYRRDHDGDGILEYAQKFRSAVGLHDGLFWPVEGGEPQSPIGQFVAVAADEGYGSADTAYHGYRYRILTAQGSGAPGGAYDYLARGNLIGGFAVLAFPAAYGDSGVMTFLMSHDGVVYQKDLGEDTEGLAHKMDTFDPQGWARVSEEDLQPISEP